MLAAKIHLLATILVVQAIALYEQRVPYFPIEISRTAASSQTATYAMILGFGSLLWHVPSYTAPALIIWVGLMIVALVPDTYSVGGHMAGVGLVFLGAIVNTHSNHGAGGWLLIAFALVIYVLRIVFKGVALLLLDKPTLTASLQSGVVVALHQRIRDIMFGRAVDVAPALIPYFQLSGVLQWVVFFALSYLF